MRNARELLQCYNMPKVRQYYIIDQLLQHFPEVTFIRPFVCMNFHMSNQVGMPEKIRVNSEYQRCAKSSQ